MNSQKIKCHKPVFQPEFCKPIIAPRTSFLFADRNAGSVKMIALIFFASKEVLPLRNQEVGVIVGNGLYKRTINAHYELYLKMRLPCDVLVILPGGVRYEFTAYQAGRLHVNLCLEDAEIIARALHKKQSLEP